ncbi:MAG: hypothetical protein ACOX6T_27865 [Myxococcales bacterium]|jgi:ActR/RegA family two-component response regulator
MRILLIVDDEPELEPLFRRFLRRDFDEIHFAGDAAAAEAVLSSVPVTHLVIDNALGRGSSPSGIDLIAGWRRAHPSIELAVLFTGAAPFSESARPPEIDEVYIKPTGFEPLLAYLRQR